MSMEIYSLIEDLKNALSSVAKDSFRVAVISGGTGGGAVTYSDHIFIPSIAVTDSEQEIAFSKEVYVLKLTAEGCDIYVNFDRNITTDEYTIIFDGTTKMLERTTNKMYIKAPSGLSGTLRFEGLVI